MLGKDVFPVSLLRFLSYPGSTWLAMMLYLLLALTAIDLIRAANSFLHFFPDFITENIYRTRLLTAGILIFILAVVLCAGHYRFLHPVVKTIEIKIDKYANGREQLDIVAVSDFHLGYMIDKNSLRKYVEKINALQPEIIVIAGDLIDFTTRPLEAQRMDEELRQLKAPLGVYMVTGNHEYISGIAAALRFIRKTNIRLLNDEYLLPDSTFVLVGQKDISSRESLPLKEILEQAPDGRPRIAIAHQPQPALLEDAERNGIDLLFCGHTHNGQLWPVNLIVKKLFPVAYGQASFNDMHLYVSGGLGLWGPQFRIGTQSEIVHFRLKFNKTP
jgi:predicted MPP superfamily phosphohydrolase